MSPQLDEFRRKINAYDEQILSALGARFEVCRNVAVFKRENSVPMMQPNRVKEVRERYLELARLEGLPEDFASKLFELVIAATCALEDDIIDKV